MKVLKSLIVISFCAILGLQTIWGFEHNSKENDSLNSFFQNVIQLNEFLSDTTNVDMTASYFSQTFDVSAKEIYASGVSGLSLAQMRELSELGTSIADASLRQSLKTQDQIFKSIFQFGKILETLASLREFETIKKNCDLEKVVVGPVTGSKSLPRLLLIYVLATEVKNSVGPWGLEELDVFIGELIEVGTEKIYESKEKMERLQKAFSSYQKARRSIVSPFSSYQHGIAKLRLYNSFDLFPSGSMVNLEKNLFLYEENREKVMEKFDLLISNFQTRGKQTVDYKVLREEVGLLIELSKVIDSTFIKAYESTFYSSKSLHNYIAILENRLSYTTGLFRYLLKESDEVQDLKSHYLLNALDEVTNLKDIEEKLNYSCDFISY